MSNIDEQFVEFVVKSLVNNPDAVKVERRIDEKGVLLELTVDPEDLGRVIGKRGATAQSLRTLLRALGTKNDARYNLKIVDNGTGEHRKPREDDSSEPRTEKPIEQKETNNTKDNSEKYETSVPTKEEVVTHDEDSADDRLSKTRRELEDLDDLDI